VVVPEDQIQWRVWIVPDYDEKNSVMIWKSHHVIGDGIGVMTLLGTLSDEYDINNFI